MRSICLIIQCSVSLEKLFVSVQSIGEVLDIPGKVKLQNPTHTLCLILDFHSKDDAAKTCNCIYFGRVVISFV